MESTLIIIGKVVDILPQKIDRLALIQVQEILKGKTTNKTLKVFFYGPKPDGNKTSVDAEIRVLQFEKGEKALLFLREGKDDYFDVVNLDYGKLKIIKENGVNQQF